MESTFTLLRVRGIPIGINWTWLFVFALITWSLAAALFPQTHPGLDTNTYLVMGAVTSVLFFGSILLHELGHAFRALKEGMRIDGITLWLFGGVAKFSSMFPSAAAEFRIAVAGPLVSVMLAVGFGVVGVVGGAIGAPDPFVGVVDWLARINAILVGFNMVPALPLDGGRVLRAWLWHRQGSFSAATISAAKAGRTFAGLLIAIGVLGLFTGAGIGGLWFVFLGWFLMQASQAEVSLALLTRAFQGLRVRDLMTPDPVTVDPWLPVEDFIDQAARSRHSSYPVVEHDRLAGLVTLRLASGVKGDERYRSRVGDVMLRGPDVPVLDPGMPMMDALEKLREGPGRAIIVDGERIEGIISVSDVARALELEQIRGERSQERSRGAGLGVWLVVGALMLLAAGFLYRPPLAVLAPSQEVIDVSQDIEVVGIEVHELTGRYLLTAAELSQPTAIGALWAVFHPHREVVAMRQVIPQDVDPGEFIDHQRQMFRESQLVAAAAAAQAAGMEVSITGTGALVVAVVDGAPADNVLEAEDVIVEVDGTPVSQADELQGAIRARPAGTTFTFTVERGQARLQVDIQSERLGPEVEGAVGIGVFITTRDLDVALPFEVSFREREIGGPSAGLAYSLALADMLQPDDLAQGRTIAMTGTVDLDGRVGAVGGIPQKLAAAEQMGADVFLMPGGQVDDAQPDEIRVVGVRNLEEALRALRGTS